MCGCLRSLPEPCIKQINMDEEGSAPKSSCKLLKIDDKKFVSGYKGQIKVWNIESNQPIVLQKEGEEVTGLQLTNDGYLISSTICFLASIFKRSDDNVRIWDLKNESLKNEFIPAEKVSDTGDVQNLVVLADQRVAFSIHNRCYNRATLVIWDPLSPTSEHIDFMVQSMSQSRRTNRIKGLIPNDKGQLIALYDDSCLEV